MASLDQLDDSLRRLRATFDGRIREVSQARLMHPVADPVDPLEQSPGTVPTPTMVQPIDAAAIVVKAGEPTIVIPTGAQPQSVFRSLLDKLFGR
jgi:hypothetical protein